MTRAAEPSAARDHLAGLEAHLPGGLPDLRDLRRDLEVVAAANGRQEVDRRVGAEEPLVAVVADEKLRGGIAEELQDVRSVDEAAAVVRLLRSDAQAQQHPLAHAPLPAAACRREISSSRKAATREAVVPGPKPAS